MPGGEKQFIRGVNYSSDVHPSENPFHHWPESQKESWADIERIANRHLEKEEIQKEMSFAKEKLHVNAIRIAGHSTDEAMNSARAALESGITPWLSPRFFNATFDQTRQQLGQYVERAISENLQKNPLIVANELPFDCSDDPVTGQPQSIPPVDRIGQVTKNYIAKHDINSTKRVAQLMQDARRLGWKGPLAYAALPDEYIDWDAVGDDNVIVGVNYYWGKNYEENRRKTSEEYEDGLKRHKERAGGRPFILTEFGTVPQEGGSGGGGFKMRGKLDYAAQAKIYKEYLDILERNGVGYFAFTFDEPSKQHLKTEHQSYGLVIRKENNQLQLTPAGKVFAHHNVSSRVMHGSVI